MTDLTPAQLEATGATTVDITFKGSTYTMLFFADPQRDLPGDVLDEIENGHPGKALAALCAPGEWAKFKKTKPTAGDYVDLLDAWATAVGQGSAGE